LLLPLSCVSCSQAPTIKEWRDTGHRKECTKNLGQDVRAGEFLIKQAEKNLAQSTKIHSIWADMQLKKSGKL
jgi:hypothetical protein